jgi:hypothetical protein
VVVAALLDAAQRVELGQDDPHHTELVHQPQAGERAGRADDAAQLGEDPLPCDLRQPVRALPRTHERSGLDDEVELGGEPCEPQHPQRVVGERPLRDHPQPPGAQVGEPAERIDRRTWLAAGPKRLGDRVDGEITAGEVLLDAGAAEAEQIELPAVVPRGHPPATERLGELKCMP